jgi:hypothetical protein
MTIQTAEQQILSAASSGSREWKRGAAALLSVSEMDLAQLSLQLGTWISSLAEKAGVRSSDLWRWLRAGQFYERLRDGHADLPPVECCPFGLSTLELLAKIKRAAPSDQFEGLYAGVLTGRVGQATLRERWKAYAPAVRGRPPLQYTEEQFRVWLSHKANPREAFAAHATSLLLDKIVGLAIVEDVGFPVVCEIARWPASPRQLVQGPELSVLCIDENQALTIHLIFFDSSPGNFARTMELINGRTGDLSNLCDYTWVILPSAPNEADRAVFVKARLGVLVADADTLPIALPSPKRVGRGTAKILTAMAIERLTGGAVWLRRRET